MTPLGPLDLPRLDIAPGDLVPEADALAPAVADQAESAAEPAGWFQFPSAGSRSAASPLILGDRAYPGDPTDQRAVAQAIARLLLAPG